MTKNKSDNARSTLIGRQIRQLIMPRFQMSFIILLTGIVGFLSSFSLLYFGISQMWIRYPMAILISYGTFLVFLRIWLVIQNYQNKFDLDFQIDLPVSLNSNNSADSNVEYNYGGGGDFGGGGAGGKWGEGVSSYSSSNEKGSSALESLSLDFDLEELGFFILAVIALLGGLFASFYVVYVAPVLFAEILVDGLLAGSLYKRVGRIESRHWLHTAIGKTLVPALLCAIFFGIFAVALQIIAPESKSIGEVWYALISS